MLDCSRNAVFTVEKVKSFIRIMAKLGMNTLMLYTEETYTVPDEPYFGAYRGRYSRMRSARWMLMQEHSALNLFRVSRHWPIFTML